MESVTIEKVVKKRGRKPKVPTREKPPTKEKTNTKTRAKKGKSAIQDEISSSTASCTATQTIETIPESISEPIPESIQHPINCRECKKPFPRKDDTMAYCYGCDKLCCLGCLETVCGDCCVLECYKCSYSESERCGCYGRCCMCGDECSRENASFCSNKGRMVCSDCWDDDVNESGVRGDFQKCRAIDLEDEDTDGSEEDDDEY
jgi:hypothetical protein